MTLLQSILLGIIQGLTEFLPVSSSAHLVITPFIFGWKIPEIDAFIFDVLVQLGTLLAVIIYFRNDLVLIVKKVIDGFIHKRLWADPASRLGWLIVIGTLPAVVAGLVFKDPVEKVFSNPQATAIFLLGTALLLVLAELVGKRDRQIESLTWLDALLIGLFQAVALLPGISRSGSTITGGMIRNLDRPSAARFSFLLMIPAMLGAGTLATVDLLKLSNFSSQLPTLVTGFITSAVVGYISIRWLLTYLTRHKLYPFAIYCVAMAVFVLLLTFFRS